MRLYSYVVTFDSGFAPNPFFRICTLACCKPQIRRGAQLGDWIAGLSPKASGNKLVYAMQVAEKVTFADYWRSPAFKDKIPDLRSRDPERHCGDNIYEPLGGEQYRQHQSAHSAKDRDHDLGGKYVLAARDFVYFGAEAVPLPPEFSEMIVGRAHKCNFAPGLVHAVVQYVCGFGFGVHGKPSRWPPAWSRRGCAQPSCPTPEGGRYGVASRA